MSGLQLTFTTTYNIMLIRIMFTYTVCFAAASVNGQDRALRMQIRDIVLRRTLVKEETEEEVNWSILICSQSFRQIGIIREGRGMYRKFPKS